MATCERQRDSDIVLQDLPRSEHPGSELLNDSGGAFPAKEKWNDPPINVYRSLSTFWSFLVMGANDAAYGVSI